MSSSPSPGPIEAIGAVLADGASLAAPWLAGAWLGGPEVGAGVAAELLHAAATIATTAVAMSTLRWPMVSPPPPRSVTDREVVLPLPDQAHGPTLRGECLHRRDRQVLRGDHELAPRIERHHVARVRAEVDDVADRAAR